MAAGPKSRISKSRRGNRRAHHALVAPTLMDCPRCGEKKLTHHVCPNCGTYNGVPVTEPRARANA